MVESYGRIRSENLHYDYNDGEEPFSGGITVVFNAYYDVNQVQSIVLRIIRNRMDRFQSDSHHDIDYYNYVISGRELRHFCRESRSMLKEIDEIGPIITRRGCGIISCSIKEVRRAMLICKYMEMCKGYVDISYTCEINIPKAEYCLSCGGFLDGAVTKNNSYWKCKCGYVTYYNKQNIDSIDIGSEYDPRVTFIKECIYFQGREDEQLPPKMFEKLDKFFFKNNGLVREEILNSERDKYGKTRGTSLSLLLYGLKECGYSSYYKRANGIGKLYWGWELPDLQPLMTSILYYYEQYLLAYSKIEERSRKSNISLQSTLLRILELVGIRVRNEDFKLCTTVQSIETCEDLWSKVCQISGMKYIRHF